MSTLGSYLKATGTRQADFADAVGVRQSTISKFISGQTRPSIDVAFAIERETGGAVKASEWARGDHGHTQAHDHASPPAQEQVTKSVPGAV